MSEPQAYLNGKFVPATGALLPVSDAGFVQGATVAEQLRTFGGRLFRLEMHLERLFHSLAIIDVDPGHSQEQISEIANELAAGNHALLADGDDLGMALFVTPGEYPAMVSGQPEGATICLHTFPLRFDLWADKYEQGEQLATTDVEQIPPGCWPAELKCRSRMHYFLADRQARRRYPGSRALMLDHQGNIVEATSANVVLYREDTGLLLPPADKILPGISLAVLLELAEEFELPFNHRDLKPADVAEAHEVFLTSTSPCMIPVVAFNGRPIGSGRPGPVFDRFISAWSDLVGLEVVEQAQRFAIR